MSYVYVLISINTFKCIYEGNMFGNQKKRYIFSVRKTSQYERCPEYKYLNTQSFLIPIVKHMKL